MGSAHPPSPTPRSTPTLVDSKAGTQLATPAQTPGTSGSSTGPADTPGHTPTPRSAGTILSTGGAERSTSDGIDFSAASAQLDHYRLKGVLGQGGMGLVYEAHDQHLDRPVALKVVLKSGHAQTVRRFMAEARVTGRLEHPNIVPAHDLCVEANGRIYFTMKLVRGETLKVRLDRWKGQPLTTTTVFEMLSIVVKVCDALAFAHSRNVVHRDIKPPNIMIGEFGEVLVMDWGVARVDLAEDDADRVPAQDDPHDPSTRTRLTAFGSVIGTPRYMSPEQADADAEAVGPRSDVYSVGAVLYEMLTGAPPVEGGSVTQMLRDTMSGNITPPLRRAPSRGIPPELAALAMKALALKPDDRYLTMTDLKRDIERFLEGRSVSAHADSAWSSVVKLMRRNLAATIIGSIAAVLMLMVVAIAFVQVLAERNIAVGALAQRQQAETERTRAEAETHAALAEKSAHALRRLRAFDPFSQAMDLLMRGQKADEAVALLRTAMAIDPDFPEATYALGQSLEADGQPAEAARAYLDAEVISERVTGKPHLQSLLAAAFAFNNDGSYREAEEAFARAERLGADHPVALVGKACRLGNGGRLNEARETAERALKLAPHLWETHYGYGQAVSGSINDGYLPVEPWRALVIAEYRKALELTPRQSEVIRALAGELFLVEGHQSEALALLDGLVAALPKSGNTHLERALLRARGGDLAGAAEDIGEADRLGASRTLLAIDAGLVAYIRHDIQDAYRIWGEAVRLSPGWPPLIGEYLNIACVVGRFAEEKPLFERWCAENPTYPEVFLLKAQIAFQAGADAEVIATTEAGLAIAPFHANLCRVRAMAQLRSRRYDDCLATTDRALALEPHDWDTQMTQVMALFALKRYQDCAVVIAEMERTHPERAEEAAEARKRYAEPR